MTWKRALTGVLVIVILLAGGVLVYGQFFSQTSAPDAAATVAAPADVVIVARDGAVSAEGRVVPRQWATLAFSAGGVVAEVVVAEGAPVEAGQAILRLDDTDQQLALTRAEAALSGAQANRMAAGVGLETARTAVEAAALDVTSAEAELALARAEPRAEEIALSEAQLALAEARVEQAAAGQALVLEGIPDSRVRAAEAEWRAAEARAIAPRLRLEQERGREEPDADALAQAERDYNAALAAIEAARQALDELAEGATSDQRNAAASAVSAVVAQRDAAATELDQVRAGGREEQVAIAEAGLAAARAAEAEAEAQLQVAGQLVTGANAEVTRAEAAVAAARSSLEERTLRAPFGGIVADIPVSVGEVIGAGVPAAVVADFGGWLVETTDLTELDVAEVAVGAVATVRVDALPDATLNGVVTEIAAISQEVRGDTTYEVTIGLDDAPEVPLRWGMTVFAAFGDGDATALSAPSGVVTGGDPVNAEGQLLPLDSVALSFQIPGRVVTEHARVGQSVAAGDPLISLDDAALAAALQQAEAGLASAEASLATARAEQIAAQARQSTAEAAVVAAEARLALAQAGARPEQLAAAERGVAAAEAGVRRAAAERDATLAVSDAAVGAARAELAAAQAQLAALQEAYDTLLTTCVTLPDGSEVCPLLGAPEENARAQLAAAEATYSAARLALAEAQSGATDAERRSAGAGVSVAIAEQTVAEAQRAFLAAGAPPEEIRLAEIGVTRARLGLSTAGAAVESAEASVAQAEASVAAATAAVAETRSALDRAILRAPFAGTVAENTVAVGEWVTPGVPVVRLGSTGWLVETTDLVELDVVRIAVGQPVAVVLDALPGETLYGTVVYIGRVPEIVLGDVTYRVRIALDDVPDLPLRWGMTALVSIETR